MAHEIDIKQYVHKPVTWQDIYVRIHFWIKNSIKS